MSKMGQFVLMINEDYYNMSTEDFVKKYDEEKMAQMAMEWHFHQPDYDMRDSRDH